MQLYFPNFKTVQGAISIFDYLVACKESSEENVIFNSDLNLENLMHLPGGTGPVDNYRDTDISAVHSFISFVVANWTKANSQVFQDLYALWVLDNKRNGVFVEIGTAYPSWHNNTWIMESQMGWNGALAEANPKYAESIKEVRSSPLTVNAIYHETGLELGFAIVDDFEPSGGILENFERKIGIENYKFTDQFTVKTIAMCDFLAEHDIPKQFDYLSFDTTGNEADVTTIESMLAAGYQPGIISTGHNYKSHRPALTNMLKSYGYNKQFDFLSRWDDWYYHTDIEEYK